VIAQPAATEPSTLNQYAPIGQLLLGVDVAAASSTDPTAVFLASANADVPLFSGNDVRNARWYAGGHFGIAGIAQPTNLSTVTSLGSVPSYLATALNATPDKIVQSIEGSINLGVKLGNWSIPGGTFDSGTPPSTSFPTTTLVSLSGILGGGAISPLSPSQASPAVYYATNQIINDTTTSGLVPPATCSYGPGTNNPTVTVPPCYIAYVPVDRTHFYRHYEAGVRLRVYGEDFGDNKLRYPGFADFTVGQNEYVTGGKLHQVVVHIGATLPVTSVDGLYAFGAVDMGLSNTNGNGAQLILSPVPNSLNLTYTSPSVFVIPTQQPNRDRYNFGVGFDFYHLFQMISKKGS
jgi:hypothetical protein